MLIMRSKNAREVKRKVDRKVGRFLMEVMENGEEIQGIHAPMRPNA